MADDKRFGPLSEETIALLKARLKAAHAPELWDYWYEDPEAEWIIRQPGSAGLADPLNVGYSVGVKRLMHEGDANAGYYLQEATTLLEEDAEPELHSGLVHPDLWVGAYLLVDYPFMGEPKEMIKRHHIIGV